MLADNRTRRWIESYWITEIRFDGRWLSETGGSSKWRRLPAHQLETTDLNNGHLFEYNGYLLMSTGAYWGKTISSVRTGSFWNLTWLPSHDPQRMAPRSAKFKWTTDLNITVTHFENNGHLFEYNGHLLMSTGAYCGPPLAAMTPTP